MEPEKESQVQNFRQLKGWGQLQILEVFTTKTVGWGVNQTTNLFGIS